MATTIGVVATDAVLTKAQANKVAQMAHDGLARCINPVHTMTDGDTLFALATGASGRAGQLTLLGALAAEVTARAVLNAVRAATRLGGAGPARPALAAPTCRPRMTPTTPMTRRAALPAGRRICCSACALATLKPPQRSRRPSSSCTATATPPRCG